MDNYNYHWPYSRMTRPREAENYGLDELSAQFGTLSRKINASSAQLIQSVAVICEYCGGNHPSHQCAISFESVQYSGNFDDYPNNYEYSSNYHHDWGNPLKFSWSDDNLAQPFAPSQSYTPKLPVQAPNHEEERILNLEGLISKFMVLIEEQTNSQEMSIQNLENQVGQLFNAIINRPQGEVSSNMVPETDGLPLLNLEPDVPKEKDVEREETSGEQEKKVAKDLALSSDIDEPILIVPHISSPPKFKDPTRFAISCPIGSHFFDKAIYDMEASLKLVPWCEENGKRDEEPVVLEKLQRKNSFTDTTRKMPSYLKVVKENLSKKNKLGEFESITLTDGKLLEVTLLLMDGGFLNFRRGIG